MADDNFITEAIEQAIMHNAERELEKQIKIAQEALGDALRKTVAAVVLDVSRIYEVRRMENRIVIEVKT